MTLMSVRPDSSAASAMSPSVDPIACGPPGQVQVTMCNPIFMIVLSGSAVPACGWGLENCRSCGAPSIAINLEVDGAQAVVEVLEVDPFAAGAVYPRENPSRRFVQRFVATGLQGVWRRVLPGVYEGRRQEGCGW